MNGNYGVLVANGATFEDAFEKLQKQTNALIAEGYAPQGGVGMWYIPMDDYTQSWIVAQAMSRDDGKSAKTSQYRASDESKLYILWLGQGENYYEAHDGTLEEAIASVKVNRRYSDYGHKGALIIRGKPLYEIKMGPIERTFQD